MPQPDKTCGSRPVGATVRGRPEMNKTRKPRRRQKKPGTRPAIRLVREGIRLGSEVVPLVAGSVHYWRLERSAWRPALESMKSLGLRLVDTYVPWGVHETAPGEYDFGQKDERLDVVEFLRLSHELGLYAIVRPGPHVNAELTYFGLPERVIWDPACQARSSSGRPVVLPVPPLAFPVPSYASEAFHAEVARWFGALGGVLASLRWPAGPIVLIQVDNEGAMYFRDGVYDQDYHPDAIARYRRFLLQKYENVPELQKAHGDTLVTFAEADPPRRFAAATALELVSHLDWAEFQEQLLADAFSRMREALIGASLGGVPTSHNLPLGEGATPLDPARVGRAVDLVGLDYYHGASPPQRSEIARRTTELSVRAELRNQPAFACELGAGFPPFFPPLGEDDNAFTVLSALAYGLRGFNVYMAVERDRWIGAPIDRHGTRRPSASFWEQLLSALERTRFYSLRREASVHIVVPRSFRRLARVLHAFGPLSPALFSVLGGGPEEACFEDDLGLETATLLETARLLQRLERELDARRIAYAFVSGDLIQHALERGRWTIVMSSGALEPEIIDSVERARGAGMAVSLGPRWPERDAMMQPLGRPPKLEKRGNGVAPLLDANQLSDQVERARSKLELPSLGSEPDGVFVTLHADQSGTPRVAFVLNPTESGHSVRLALKADARDALDGATIHARKSALELFVPRRSVRMLEITLPGS
jgi:beta-galactosidase